MKLRLVLPFAAALACAAALPVSAADTDAAALKSRVAQLERDLHAAMNQRDELQARLAEAGAQLPSDVAELQRALREAEMKVDMTARAFGLKEEEVNRANAAAAEAASKQASAERERDDAIAAARQASAERDTARQALEAALSAKAQMQNDLYAAQIRIENLSRALTRSGAAGLAPMAATPPTPVVAEAPAPAAAPEAAAEPKPAETAPRTHTVLEGETLSSIAKKYYGAAGKWDVIFNANRDKLKTADHVTPGVVLKIP